MAMSRRGEHRRPGSEAGGYDRMASVLSRAGWLSEWRRGDGRRVELYWRKPDTQQWRVTPEAYQAMMDAEPQGFLFGGDV